MSVIVVAAVAQEVAPLIERMDGATWRHAGRAAIPICTGGLDGSDVIAVATGVGKANAASVLTGLLASPVGESVVGIIATGVAGATHASGLALRTLLLASEEIFADEGVITPTGFLSCSELGLPIVPGPTPSQRIRLHSGLIGRAQAALARYAPELQVATGPLATVSCCAGTSEREAWLASTWGALGESMEGAAWALVAQQYAVPFLELRAVSNQTGTRDRAAWDLEGAILAACAGVRVLLRAVDQDPRGGAGGGRGGAAQSC